MGLKTSKQQRINSPHNEMKNPTYFEHLSNELIYEVFDYLSFHDIILPFGKLNRRFRSLIDNYSHYVNLQQHAEDNNQALPQYIRSLKINARYQLSFIDFSTIISPRCLIISNLWTAHLHRIFGSFPLNELEYIYIGACWNQATCQDEQAADIQLKIFRLGELKLKRCVLRTKFVANIDQLPTNLSSLEYLRIDGCENVSIINRLLDHMPNLKFFRVSILQSFGSNDTKKQYIKYKTRNYSLTNLIIRLHDLGSINELRSLFLQYCSKVKNLVVFLNPIIEDGYHRITPDSQLVNFQEWITTMINESLPQLTHFHLRQRIILRGSDHISRPIYNSPYIQEVPCSLMHRSYRVFISLHLASIWQNTA